MSNIIATSARGPLSYNNLVREKVEMQNLFLLAERVGLVVLGCLAASAGCPGMSVFALGYALSAPTANVVVGSLVIGGAFMGLATDPLSVGSVVSTCFGVFIGAVFLEGRNVICFFIEGMIEPLMKQSADVFATSYMDRKLS